MESPIDKLSSENKNQHSCGRVISLIIALGSYAFAFALIIDDIFSSHQISSSKLEHFHAYTTPLILNRKWIASTWLTVYGAQIPWLLYAITTLCRRNGDPNASDYLYKYPSPVSQMQLITFSLGCWSHLIFLYLIQHQSYILASIYILIGAMALLLCFLNSIIHLYEYERQLSSSNLFADIRSIRVFVHNGLSVMLTWQIALIGFSSAFAYNKIFRQSDGWNKIDEPTLNLIKFCLIGIIGMVTGIYGILMLCCLSNFLSHIVAGWIFLILLSLTYLYNRDFELNSLNLILLYTITGSLCLILCLHLVLLLFRCFRTTCRTLTNSNRNSYRHDILQEKD